MTDRELLERAAKAAGMYVLPEPWPEVDGWFFCLQHEKPALHFRKVGNLHAYFAPWTPLTDDGDALRLAIKLRITITYRGNAADCFTLPERPEKSWPHWTQPWGRDAGDDTAATRHAIVRAAAEVGQGGEAP